MTARFDTKDAAELRVLTFDFTLDLEGAETLAGTPAVTVETILGDDPAPLGILGTGAAFDATSKMYLIPVTGGTPGAEYAIKVVAATTNVKKTSALIGILPVG